MDPTDLLYTNQFIAPETKLPLQLSRKKTNIGKEYLELKNFLQKELKKKDPFDKEQKAFLSDEEDDYDLFESHSSLASTLNRPVYLSNQKPLALSHGVRPLLSKEVSDLTRYRYRKMIIKYINVDSRHRNKKKYPNPGKYTLFLNKEFHNINSMKLASIEFREPPLPINSTNNCFTWTTNYTGLTGFDSNEDNTVQYQTKIPGAYFTLSEFVQIVETTANAVPHDLSDFDDMEPHGQFPAFRLTIDPFSRAIRFIQRLEELVVSSIATTKGSNLITIRIQNQGNPPTPPTSTNYSTNNTGYPFFPVTSTPNTLETVPLLLTGLELFATQFGGIPVTLLDQVPFYPPSVTSASNTLFNTYTIVTPTSYDGTNHEFIYQLSVFNDDGSPALSSMNSFTTLSTSLLPNFPAGHPVQVTVGRALSFTVENTIPTTASNGCASSPNGFGHFLGLQDGEKDILIHTNFNLELDEVQNTIPWMVIGAGQLVLDTTDYIFMRLETTSKPIGTISANLTSTRKVPSERKSTEGGRCDQYFAKIIFAGTSPGDVTVRVVGDEQLFYDAPLVKLTDLQVSFFDSCGNPLSLLLDHSFTLQIVEQREILKETLIDSRTGVVADLGGNIETTNPISS